MHPADPKHQKSRTSSGGFHGKTCASSLPAPSFVNAGILFYLYLARVSVPLLGTGYVQTPELSGVRSILHFIFFLLTFYYGFIRKEKSQ
jgi:hypothetical protein